MKVLLDQGTPAPLRRYLRPHVVQTCADRGWSSLDNGDLLDRAEAEGFEALITTDQNLRQQQNLAARRIRVLVLTTTSWPRIRNKTRQVREALENLVAGGYCEIDV